MARTTLRSALLTKRGVVLALVVGAAVLGTGVGLLPELLGGPDDAEVSTSETTRQSDATAETVNERDGSETATEADDGQTPPATATTEPSEVVAGPDDRTTGRTQTVTRARTTDRETTRNGETVPDDEPAAVGVEAEANTTASSLADYPTRSRRLNAVVNPPNAARTAGGA